MVCSAYAQTSVAPRISPEFPPAEDIRQPDLTIAIGHGPVTSVRYSEDGRWLATVTGDDVARLWEVRPGEQGTGAFIREVKDADAVVLSAPSEISRDTLLRATVEGRTVKLWDVPTGTLLATLEGHTANVLSVAFSSNGQKMATGSADGTARTWTVPLPPVPAATLQSIASAIPANAVARPGRPRRILVVWRADAILHKSGVPALNHAIELMGKRTGAFEADFTRDADAFDLAVLSKYDAIVMNSTAHLILNDAQRSAYLEYVRRGGGVVGFHAAIDMFLTWPEGAKVIGATFGDHPWGPNGTWAVKLETPDHPLLRAFGGKNFTIRDEFYVMGEPYLRSDRRVLMSVNLSDAATGAVNLVANPARAKDKDFALAWTKRYGQGRVFYANFGHVAGAFERPDILQFYLDGIQWVLGDLAAE